MYPTVPAVTHGSLSSPAALPSPPPPLRSSLSRERPKSATLAVQAASRRMLGDLMSRWMMGGTA
uniref:Uncharacterized protein n=1 Tax=Arundo donax TaxID=35708 RepID=A0A0A9G8K6_ARUDO